MTEKLTEEQRRSLAVGGFPERIALSIIDDLTERLESPIPMVLHCPECRARHIDEGAFATKPHHTHSCQSCGLTWRPSVRATVGVQFLPGFKNEPSAIESELAQLRERVAKAVSILRRGGRLADIHAREALRDE